MNQDKFWFLLSKKITGEANQAEIEELERIIRENPEWHGAIKNFEDLWHCKPERDNLTSEDAYLLHMNRMKENQIRFGEEAVEIALRTERSLKKKWWLRVAAAAVILISLAALSTLLFNKKEKQQIARSVNEISTRHGSKSKVELPDGSVVWLNAGSKLTYTKDYGKEIREVTLTGEGFFDVMKMKDKPFIIHTSNINIKVLGTVFNVRAYPDDKQTETSLISGRVEVTIKNRPNDKIILSPSEKLVVENGIITPGSSIMTDDENNNPLHSSPLVSVNKLNYHPKDSTIAETEWVNNRLVFRNETFEDLAKQMERWYDVNIEINSPALRQARLNGTFEKESVTQALEALKEMISFRYEIKNNQIIINY